MSLQTGGAAFSTLTRRTRPLVSPEQLRDAVIEARSQIVAPGQLCAWARI